MAAAWAGAHLYFAGRLAAAVKQGTERAERDADTVAREVSRSLRRYRGFPALLAERRLLAEAATRRGERQGPGAGGKAAPGPVDAFLARAANELGADVVWLLDAAGTCVASSNAGTPESFVGTDYSDREYYLQARAGRGGKQFAVGRRTGIPGMFFSAPVHAGGRFVGALVVKINLSQLSYWVGQSDAFIADANGVVIMARDASLEMRAVPGAGIERLPAIARLQRYAREAFPALSLQPWGDARFPALQRLEERPVPVALISRPLPEEDTQVFVVAGFPEIAALDSDLRWLFLLLAVGGAGLLAVGSGRLASARQERRERLARQQLEEQLRQAQKLESIGRLAGGVAHDFNNLLTVILSCTDALQADAAAGAPASPELVEDIRGAGQRAAALTRQLLAFARKQVIAPVPLDLNATVAAAEKLLRRVLGEDVELTTALQPALWTVRCDPGQIEQAILNLAINARDAMPGGGRLAIETANVQVDEALVARHPFMVVGPHVRLAMRDSGIGLSPEARAHAFEPFFTTKPQGKGTGLGLATVYGIVKQSGGFILLESEPGRGATFELYFPRSLEAVPEAPAVLPRTSRGSETVLLVEDDAQLRQLALRSLQSLGYRVTVAATGREALELATRQGHPFDLLLTDVIMPGLNGRELADELRRRHPDLRVLFMSGYTQEVISRAGVLDSGIEFLPKPFTVALLHERVRQALDAGWAERLVTGIGEIDDQHRALLATIAAFGQGADDGHAGVLQGLEIIHRYVVDHFATEEQFMESAGYPGLAQHRAIHGAFVAELQRRKARWESRREAVSVREVAEWFSTWLHDHIRGPDAEMAGYLRSTRRTG